MPQKSFNIDERTIEEDGGGEVCQNRKKNEYLFFNFFFFFFFGGGGGVGNKFLFIFLKFDFFKNPININELGERKENTSYLVESLVVEPKYA